MRRILFAFAFLAACRPEPHRPSAAPLAAPSATAAHAPPPAAGAREPVSTTLALGRAFSCLLTTRGQVRCWGTNDSGQRGGDGLGGVLALAAGPDHACAVQQDVIRCWGKNDHGQLGDGSRIERPSPVLVREMGRAGEHIQHEKTQPVLTRDSSCFFWSEEYSGSFAACTGAHLDTDIFGLTGRGPAPPCPSGTLCSKVYAASGAAFESGLCTLSDVNGVPRVACPFGPPSLAPRQPERDFGSQDDGKTVGVLVVGRDFACGLGAGGVLCWGSNTRGQLGRREPAGTRDPLPVEGMAGAAALCAGAEHACAQKADGRVLCWGDGRRGQLGTGDPVAAGTVVEVPAAAGAKAIGCGEAHTCAAFADGRVVCWGADEAGQSSGSGKGLIAAPSVVTISR
ncbi:RCC1 domain-containing protein [Polyangium sp. y55x31]|uniref:RCC1 domain-containing protein n=1 Tax=Polyangium sp. y55x31 TaxID=3042688 RepID=UPI0024822207|nr:RCC1 domain-containing protein [Polyangium sp. y55x31]MDI1476739.1 hypothetical protein [Polyangium sp. y55x31]